MSVSRQIGHLIKLDVLLELSSIAFARHPVQIAASQLRQRSVAKLGASAKWQLLQTISCRKLLNGRHGFHFGIIRSFEGVTNRQLVTGS